jgi:methylenetetrahydrofolate--tRNA-(uracil-5-)-methyltransferase
MDIVYKKSRYDRGEAAYLNCPMTKEAVRPLSRMR